MVAFRKAGDVPDAPLGWLFATARRLLANKSRGLRRRDQLLLRLAEEAAETCDLQLAEARYVVLDALRALSAHDREVLTLTGWYGLTPSEAAQALGCSPGTYAVRLHRARQRFADHIHPIGATGTDPSLHLLEVLRDY